MDTKIHSSVDIRGQSCAVTPQQADPKQFGQQHKPSGGSTERPQFPTVFSEDLWGAQTVSTSAHLGAFKG